MTPDDCARLVDATFAETVALHDRVRRAIPDAVIRAADAVAGALRAGATGSRAATAAARRTRSILRRSSSAASSASARLGRRWR